MNWKSKLLLLVGLVAGQFLCQGETIITSDGFKYTFDKPVDYCPKTYPGIDDVKLTATPNIASATSDIILHIATQTNWYVVSYALYGKALSRSQWGGGIGYFYPLSTYVVTGARLEWLNGGFWMPDGSVTFQIPLQLTPHIQVTPLTFIGVGIPVSGASYNGSSVPGHVTDNNGQPSAILGLGFSVYIWGGPKWAVYSVADVESWGGFDGLQYRFGLAFHRK